MERRARGLRCLTLIVLVMGLVEVLFAATLIIAFEGDRITARQMVFTAFGLGAAIVVPLEAVVLVATGALWGYRRFRNRGSRCRYCGDPVQRGVEACSVCDFFIQIRKAA